MKITLIYDEYENDDDDWGFSRDKATVEAPVEATGGESPTPLSIYSWSLLCIPNTRPRVDIEFDVARFRCKIPPDVNLREVNGEDQVVQAAIVRHPKFPFLIQRVLDAIDEHDAKSIAFVCSHGKHRSVGWACLLKNHFPASTVTHLCSG
jgi:hypothetical protein